MGLASQIQSGQVFKLTANSSKLWPSCDLTVTLALVRKGFL